MAAKKPDDSLIREMRLLVFDFDGVMTDNAVYVFEDGREAVKCDRSDGMGVSRLRKAGFDMIILSTEENGVVCARGRKLKVECHQGVADKLVKLNSIAADRGISLSKIAYVGNDINDLDCLHAVGIPIVVADAQEEVRLSGFFVTGKVGGHGAVREVCDWFYHAREGVNR
ncbi:MAG: HAD hydrolase family protein [Nitrospinae bacterium]|nr:HAD hydrolase family protein [Nitrospinota bacterium]